jgi:hypothetical protein
VLLSSGDRPTIFPPHSNTDQSNNLIISQVPVPYNKTEAPAIRPASGLQV